MIKIEPHYNEHKMTFSGGRGCGWRGYSVMAKDLGEVKLALDHYHNKGGHGLRRKKNCPLCRKIAEEAAKGKRQ